ncbi:hypothetical protein HON52_04235 [Candidatus Uhrbacteria bacterium]|jgi:hypothetical protein|nr:hypothetical protein [Candidatus Uhrbacteria bacterium]
MIIIRQDKKPNFGAVNAVPVLCVANVFDGDAQANLFSHKREMNNF